jgi:DNA mismatch repair ATPase MutS
LRRLVEAAEQGHNAIVQLFNIPLLYMLHVAYAIEGWRREHGKSVRRWIAALGELEALVALASYSYEHPEDSLPEFVDHATLFVAEELGHPLIASAKCVRNGVELSSDRPVLLVSGSNMSGKSTLLRAIGINTVLAMAGVPVRARRLRLSPLHVGASIRVSDSLQEGSSRFYAEISRLRQIVDLSPGEIPLLFLVDEFLQGTNSRDRRIGAEALLRKLISAGALGLVTTHDLALTEVGANNGKLRNVHFQDYLEDGRMRFDYKLREGVVARSNGLELMRSIGLDV